MENTDNFIAAEAADTLERFAQLEIDDEAPKPVPTEQIPGCDPDEAALRSLVACAVDEFAESLAQFAATAPIVDPMLGNVEAPRKTAMGVDMSRGLRLRYSTLEANGIQMSDFATDVTLLLLKPQIEALIARIEASAYQSADRREVVADLRGLLSNRLPQHRVEGTRGAVPKKNAGRKRAACPWESLSVISGADESGATGRTYDLAAMMPKRLDLAALAAAWATLPTSVQKVKIPNPPGHLGVFGTTVRKLFGKSAECIAEGHYRVNFQDVDGTTDDGRTYARKGAAYDMVCSSDTGAITVVPGYMTEAEAETSVAPIREAMAQNAEVYQSRIRTWLAQQLGRIGYQRCAGSTQYYVPNGRAVAFRLFSEAWEKGGGRVDAGQAVLVGSQIGADALIKVSEDTAALLAAHRGEIAMGDLGAGRCANAVGELADAEKKLRGLVGKDGEHALFAEISAVTKQWNDILQSGEGSRAALLDVS